VVGNFVVYSFPKFFPIQAGGLLVSHERYTIDEPLTPSARQYIQKVLSAHINNLDGASKKRRDNYHAVTAAANVSLFDFAQPAVERALNVYTVYGQRFDPLAGIRAQFPRNLTVVGFLGNPDDVAISLWRPFGSRRVENILITDSPAEIRQRAIEYAVTSEGCLGENAITLPAWLHRVDADLIATVKARGRVNEGLRDWYLVRLRPEQPKSSVVSDRSFRTTTKWGEFN